MDDNEIFEGKTLSDLFEDIYENTTKKRAQIDELLKSLIPYLTNVSDVEVLGPIIKDLMDVKVKNDEALIRMAQIAQRAVKTDTGGGSNFELTEEEKRQLLETVSKHAEIIEDAEDVISKLDK